MASQKVNIRGVKNIRNHSSRPGMAGASHRAYMQLAFLEMEKARQSKERDRVMHRLNMLDVRIKQIEEEKTVLLKIGDAKANLKVSQDPASFKIRY